MVEGEEASTGSPSQRVELNARLSGPYATVSDLKNRSQGQPGVVILAAEPVHPSGRVGEQPVSRIRIPDTAAPGVYNLITSVTEAGSTVSGETIIRVIPAG